MTTGSHERTTIRRLGLALLLPLLLSFSVGCTALNFLRPRPDKAEGKDKSEQQIDRPAGAALPNKHQIRIAPFVFLSDWEIPRDQPLFVELEELRDQVQKELLLPPNNA